MKRAALLILVFVVLLGMLLFIVPDKPVLFPVTEMKGGRMSKIKTQSGSSDASVESGHSSAGMLLPELVMTAVDYQIDPLALSREMQDPPFEFRGGQMTKGRVVDHDGNVILESTEGNWIHGAVVSPDKDKVLVKRAGSSGGTSLVMEPLTGRKINLPSKPPGDRMFSFSWHWLGPNLLLGVSGVEKIFHEGPHENCCNDDNVAQTRFYTFDLITEQLSGVVMPAAVTQPVVNAVEVTGDGHLHLRADAIEQDFGWFRINVPE